MAASKLTLTLCLALVAAQAASAAKQDFGHFRLNCTAAKVRDTGSVMLRILLIQAHPASAQEDLKTQYHAWAAHFGRQASQPGFQVWRDTVGERLASGAPHALVNAHADTSDADFGAAYLGQRTSVRNRLRYRQALPRLTVADARLWEV